MRKNRKIVMVVFITIVISLVGFFIYQARDPAGGSGGTENESQPEENAPYVSMEEVIAEEEGTVGENVKICFSESGPKENILAAGIIIRGKGSLVLFYDNESNLISEIENEFFPVMKEKIKILSNLSGRLSPWTGKEIVPVSLSVTDNKCSFRYYDGYSSGIESWGYGYATINLENEKISWGPHTL